MVPHSYLVPKVGAGCNPVELLVGIREVSEVSSDEHLPWAQSCWHLVAVTGQQEPPVHVDKLEGKSNSGSSSGVTESICVLMLQKTDPRAAERGVTGSHLTCILMKPQES